MEYRHEPAMLAEAIAALGLKSDGTYVDATTGGAGHLGAIIESVGPKARIVAIDRDPDSVAYLARNLARLGRHVVVRKGNFAEIVEILGSLGISKVDGVLFDLGLSSAQLDRPERGFSYMEDGPLDMRFDRDQTLTAEKIVNEYPRERLSKVFASFGEERWAGRIAEFVVKARERGRLSRTRELVLVVKDAVPAGARRGGSHPARRVFQALRIEVNGELGAVEQGVRGAIDMLAVGGRLVVISYHSLEDRLVKEILREESSACVCPKEMPECRCGHTPRLKLVYKKVRKPTPSEIERNRRARSAKLRAAEKIEPN